MPKIAIILFPGLNTEYETERAINRCGMTAEFFRWNDDYKKLAKYDGYVIGGGFSYEDRGRAGIIAALDPVMKVLKTETEKGKPLLGICNGAQIIVEAGLIPGVDGNKLAMSLARNKRIRNGEVLGVGYYNVWTNIKCVSKPKTCVFTWDIKEGEILHAPIAHGEGRFTTDIPDLIQTLQERGQMMFRYCDPHGVITEDFPVNPNGAMYNLAAICNPAGNVMAIMPHLERDTHASDKLFNSMKNAILEKKTVSKKRNSHLIVKTPNLWPLPAFQPQSSSIQMFVSLIITDNEADTHEYTLKALGWKNASLKRSTHIELSYKGRPDFHKVVKKLIQSGVLLNTNKESAKVKFPKELLAFDAKKATFVPVVKKEDEPMVMRLLVREKPDFVGMSKLSTIQKRLKFEEITDVKIGTLWEIHIPTKSKKVAEDELKKMVNTHLFFNPHRQEAHLVP